MKEILESPVEWGDVRLAPTVELAALAELAELRTSDDRLDAIIRIAAAVRAEDEAREHLSRLRSGELEAGGLPHRQR